MLDEQKITETAKGLAAFCNRRIKFSANEEKGTVIHGVEGSAWPCGCVERLTVLNDGSIGMGQWFEACSVDHIQ